MERVSWLLLKATILVLGGLAVLATGVMFLTLICGCVVYYPLPTAIIASLICVVAYTLAVLKD